MDSRSWIRRTGMSLALLAVIGTLVPLPAGAVPSVPRRPRALNLFSAAGYLLEVNRVQCGLDNFGQVCVAFSGSPVAGGGFWPKGTANGYIFNSGLQLAAVIDDDGGPWAGDTVGAFFFDPRGDQQSGNPITEIFSSLNPQDLANWPNGAVVRDTAIYNEVLIGRNQISEGDAWVRYWEGNPTQLGGRLHPMGVLVDQRAVAWNYPTGNEDIVYFIFRFYNVTASDPAVYVNPDIEPELQAEVAEIGARFHQLNNQRFGITLPTGGYTLSDMYAAFAMDNDVAQFGANYSTAVLPFNIGVTYAGNFEPEVGWTFPQTIFGKPFFAGAGFIGAKYLKSPVNPATSQEVGLTLFSNTSNGPPFPDAQGVNLLYRRLSGFLGPGDVPCNPFSNPAVARQRRLCYLAQEAVDSRFYQASGPFALAPGRAATIVVAYVHAAPVDVGVNLVGGDLAPGVPATGDLIAADPSQLRTIDSVMGWLTHDDTSGNGVIEQNEVQTVSRSLLNKALVAQAVFDNKFLLPFSPTAPQFFLVPGDDQVTVVWQTSPSEQTGDPFFAVASNPASPLYDPNFREFDVEGYRIYRGRTSSELELIAQFDYAGTTFIDYTGAIDYGDANGDGLVQCAPELGLQADCPVTFGTAPPFTTGAETPLVGTVIQIPPGSRVELRGADSLGTVARGSVVNLAADTLVTGGASGYPALSDRSPPFAFVDRNVRNSFTYHYAVTAFDINSVQSGPSSLESPRITKRVTPRVASGQTAGENEGPLVMIGGDGSTLDPNAAPPALDPATGIFSGPMPPANGVDVALSAFLPELLGSAALDVTIDSVQTGMAELDVQPGSFQPIIYYMTAQVGGAPVQFSVPLEIDRFNEDSEGSAPFEATALDSAKSSRFGGDQTYSLYGQAEVQTPGVWVVTSWGRGFANGDPENSAFNGPRWWVGAANENTVDPNGLRCSDAPTVPACVQPDLGRNAGSIAGVDIFHPSSYGTIPGSPARNIEGMTATVVRAADFAVYWGAAGVVDSVIDLTHRVPVPFDTRIRASWGILNQASFATTTAALTRDANNGLLTWSDIYCVDPAPAFMPDTISPSVNDVDCGGALQTPAVLQNTAALSPIAFQSSTYNATAGLAANGNGFIFYLNGHFFLMRTAALPIDGTVWNARFYTGIITGSAAGANFTFTPAIRPAPVPGLRLTRSYQGSTLDVAVATDLSRVHTVPDPYYVTNPLEISANNKILRFVNLPTRAIIRIYSVSGVLVTVLPHDDPTGGGATSWNLRNRNQQFVASGVYFYHVETPSGDSRVGRFTVVNFAP